MSKLDVSQNLTVKQLYDLKRREYLKANMTPEQREKRKQSMAKYLANRSPEKVAADKAKACAAQKRYRLEGRTKRLSKEQAHAYYLARREHYIAKAKALKAKLREQGVIDLTGTGSRLVNTPSARRSWIARKEECGSAITATHNT